MSTREKGIADMLREQIQRSEDFTKLNFGLKLGGDFPELARELLADGDVARYLGTRWLLEQFVSMGLLEKMKDKSPVDFVRNNPAAVEKEFSFLYWGIQIGRELEHRQAETLDAIAKREAANG